MSMRLSGVNFENFANVEVCNCLSDLRMWGVTPMLAMLIKADELLNEPDKDQRHQGYCLLNDLEGKLEDLEEALKRLDDQWDQGKLLPARKALEGKPCRLTHEVDLDEHVVTVDMVPALRELKRVLNGFFLDEGGE